MNFPRPSHALKNLLLLSGAGLAWILSAGLLHESGFGATIVRFLLVFLASCLVAAWNYALNDFCDSDGDRWHPEKSGRLAGGEKLAFTKLMASGVVLLSAAAVLPCCCGSARWALPRP